jgi:hypothetical protein
MVEEGGRLHPETRQTHSTSRHKDWQAVSNKTVLLCIVADPDVFLADPVKKSQSGSILLLNCGNQKIN